MRKILLACLVMVSFSGCLGDSPEVQSSIIDTLVGDDEPAEPVVETPVEPSPEPEATVQPETEPAEEPVAVVPEYVPRAPRSSFSLAPVDSVPRVNDEMPTLEAMAARQSGGFGQASGPQPLRTPFTFPTPDVEETPGPPAVTAPSGSVDIVKPWLTSVGGVEYAIACVVGDGVDCAYFDLPAGSAGQPFTLHLTAQVPAAAYFVDLYAGSSYISTLGDMAGDGGLWALSPDDADTPLLGAPVVTIEGIVPAGITQFQVYAVGGAYFLGNLVMGAPSACPTDMAARGGEIDGVGGGYITPLDTLVEPGSLWVYQESNGKPGVQRNDSTYGTTCGDPDTVII